MFTIVRRLARAANLPAADKISPHSLRHSAATTAFDDGAPLRDVQDFLCHADPRTTRRYDRNRGSLDRSPAHRRRGFATETYHTGADPLRIARAGGWQDGSATLLGYIDDVGCGQTNPLTGVGP